MGQRPDEVDLRNDYLPTNANIPQDDYLPENANTAADVQDHYDQQAASSADTKDENPEQIRDDIDHTRTEMGATIDAIQDRLNPQKLVEQAKDSVREATIGRVEDMVTDVGYKAQSAGNTVWETIRENPIPAALASLGLGYLIWKGRSNAQERQQFDMRSQGQMRNPSQGYQYQTYQPQGQSYNYQARMSNQSGYPQDFNARNYATASSDQSSSVKDKVSDVTDRVQGKVSDLADQTKNKVSDLTDNVQEQASQFGDQVQWRTHQTSDWFQQQLDTNPLAVAGVALAAGLVAGMAIPETQKENQLMGSTRDSLVNKAQDVAQDTAQKVQSVAHEATKAAKDEAQDQGLTGHTS